MLIDYDKRSGLTVDQKLQSLIESIQMALNEISDRTYTKDEIEARIEELKKRIDSM